jgi:hypothetical protein
MILLLGLSLAEAQDKTHVYILDINYNNGTLSTLKVFSDYRFAPDMIEPEKGYRAVIISSDKKVLYSAKFDIQLYIFTESGMIKRDNVNFTLILPYFENGETMQIYDQNNTLALLVDISNYTVCDSNGKCDYPRENYYSCPSECHGAEDGICDKAKDGICDQDCARDEDPDCLGNQIFYLLLIPIVIAAIIFVIKIIKNS